MPGHSEASTQPVTPPVPPAPPALLVLPIPPIPPEPALEVTSPPLVVTPELVVAFGGGGIFVSDPPHEAEAIVEPARRTRSEVNVVREVMRLQSCAASEPVVNITDLPRCRASAAKARVARATTRRIRGGSTP